MSVYYLEPTAGAKSFYCKAWVREVDDNLYLYSYNTFVAAIVDAEVYVTKDPDHLTASTKRHISAFLDQSRTYTRDKLSEFHDLSDVRGYSEWIL
jgi:hypothetical protein